MKTETLDESVSAMNFHLAELGIKPMSAEKAKHTFDLEGGESLSDIYQWAVDYYHDQEPAPPHGSLYGEPCGDRS